MMRRMLNAVAVAASLLSAGDAAAQRVDGAGWRAPPVALAPAGMDARLRPDFDRLPTSADALDVRARRLSGTALIVGAVAVGCVTGALAMGSGGDPRDRAPRRFNGCILGASVGGFLGGVYGLATGRW
jgi:hypothetical protein